MSKTQIPKSIKYFQIILKKTKKKKNAGKGLKINLPVQKGKDADGFCKWLALVEDPIYQYQYPKKSYFNKRLQIRTAHIKREHTRKLFDSK